MPYRRSAFGVEPPLWSSAATNPLPDVILSACFSFGMEFSTPSWSSHRFRDGTQIRLESRRSYSAGRSADRRSSDLGCVLFSGCRFAGPHCHAIDEPVAQNERMKQNRADVGGERRE